MSRTSQIEANRALVGRALEAGPYLLDNKKYRGEIVAYDSSRTSNPWTIKWSDTGGGKEETVTCQGEEGGFIRERDRERKECEIPFVWLAKDGQPLKRSKAQHQKPQVPKELRNIRDHNGAGKYYQGEKIPHKGRRSAGKPQANPKKRKQAEDGCPGGWETTQDPRGWIGQSVMIKYMASKDEASLATTAVGEITSWSPATNDPNERYGNMWKMTWSNGDTEDLEEHEVLQAILLRMETSSESGPQGKLDALELGPKGLHFKGYRNAGDYKHGICSSGWWTLGCPKDRRSAACARQADCCCWMKVHYLNFVCGFQQVAHNKNYPVIQVSCKLHTTAIKNRLLTPLFLRLIGLKENDGTIKNKKLSSSEETQARGAYSNAVVSMFWCGDSWSIDQEVFSIDYQKEQEEEQPLKLLDFMFDNTWDCSGAVSA
jgi:hypothetical protein